MPTLLAMLLSVTLAAPFGEAEVSAIRAGNGELQLSVTVEVEVGAVAVLARTVGVDGAELPPVALSNVRSGVWQGIVTVPIRPDLRMGFELIAESGTTAVVSEVHTLVELGVDPAALQQVSGGGTTRPIEDPAIEDPGDGDTRRWGWLGLAAAAAALAAVAVWVLGGRGSRRPVDIGSGNPDNTEDVDHTSAGT